ncbi:MAG: RNA-directed DNA polymerase [Proteobacteria bacterium]|nr:RNA-directed DNA polymerase [Pseudomonadota bacterium]
MFTAENFRRIYDSENRKGLDLAARYFPDLEPYTQAVRDKVKEIRELRANKTILNTDEFSAKQLTLKAELAALKTKKSATIDGLMEAISLKVLQPTFKIELTQKPGPKGKPVYCIDAKPETFFVIKQLQQNIYRIYGVKQANRHDLVCQLRDMVDTKFPFELVRTDISAFYESVDRKRLIEKLDRDHLLSPASKKYIKQVLDSYGTISGTLTGVPRGVGISAYLAELYLRLVDKSIRAIPGLVLYCRFVDDVVAVFARPPAGSALGSYKDKIIAIFDKSGFAFNPKKTLEFNLATPAIKKFEYLGYRFLLGPSGCEIRPSAAKVSKYKARMKAAFEDYWRERPHNSKRAFRNLVARIKFLTGNTRLSNSKSRATTGIYYNNPIVNELSSFELLDKLLKLRISKLKRAKLIKRLKPYKFTDGFQSRRFHNFSTRELQNIVRAWKHG